MTLWLCLFGSWLKLTRLPRTQCVKEMWEEKSRWMMSVWSNVLLGTQHESSESGRWSHNRICAEAWRWKENGNQNQLICSRGRKTQFSTAGSFPRCPQRLGLGQAAAGSWSPPWGQWLSHLSRHCCLSGCALAGSWSQERKPRLEPTHSDASWGHLSCYSDGWAECLCTPTVHLLPHLTYQLNFIVGPYV